MNPINLDIELDIKKAKETESGKWIVEGLAATTDFDLQDDIISQKALDDAASDLLTNSTVLFNHDVNQSIGKIIESKAIKDGLWIKVFISKTVPDIWEKIKEGVISKFSIRGKILDAKKSWVPAMKRWVQVVLKMRLAEVSMVTVPANPQAKALRWYIQKSLENFYEQGNDLEILKTGGDQMVIEEYLDEIMKTEDSSSEEEIKKGPAMEMIDALISVEKDAAKKKKLQELKDILSKYPKPSGSYPYPKPKGQTKKDGIEETDFRELLASSDPEVIEAVLKGIEELKSTVEKEKNDEEEKVEKAGRKISVKSESHLTSVVDKLNEAISMIKDLITQTKSVEGVEKLLEKFEKIKSLIGETSKETLTDSQESFEKIAEIQAMLAEKANKTDEKIDAMTELMSKLFKGVGAVRNQDGTISTGAEAIKGIDQRTEDKKDGNEKSIEVIKTSDKYEKADVHGKRDILTQAISKILERRSK